MQLPTISTQVTGNEEDHAGGGDAGDHGRCSPGLCQCLCFQCRRVSAANQCPGLRSVCVCVSLAVFVGCGHAVRGAGVGLECTNTPEFYSEEKKSINLYTR